VLEHAGDEHDHNASNHGHDSAATAHTNDDYNDAHGRRLLIAKAVAVASVAGTALWRLRTSKSSTEFDRPQLRTPNGLVVRRTGDSQS
jgi:hypothetical protein